MYRSECRQKNCYVLNLYVQVKCKMGCLEVYVLLPFLLMDIFGNICSKQLIMVYWVAFFLFAFLVRQTYSSVFLLVPTFFHINCLFYSLKDLIDDLDDFFLDFKVRESTTKNGK